MSKADTATTVPLTRRARLVAAARRLVPAPRRHNLLRPADGVAASPLADVLEGTGGLTYRLKAVVRTGFLVALVTVGIAYFAGFDSGIVFSCVFVSALALFIVSCLRSSENAVVTSPLAALIWPLELLVLATLTFSLGFQLMSISAWAAAAAITLVGGYTLVQLLSFTLHGRREVGRSGANRVPQARGTATLGEEASDAFAATPGEETPDAPEVAPRESLDDLFAELNAFTGLEGVKAQVRELVANLRTQAAREREGLRRVGNTGHLRFEGPPGTGKTTIARLLARFYHALGVVEHGQFVEADRAALVGEWQGHTAVKTNALCDRALGGVLFVDEFYAIVASEMDTFGAEAVSTLLKRLEDDRSRFVCIVAGYSDEMRAAMSRNPGLRSRFTSRIAFDDYSPEELLAIAEKLVDEADYELDSAAGSELADELERLYVERDQTWANGREVRTFVERLLTVHGMRVADTSASREELRTLSPADVREASLRYRCERDAERAEGPVQPISPF